MSDLTEHEQKLLQFLTKHGTPANQEQIQATCRFEDKALQEALNGLLTKSRVEIFNKGKQLYFSAVSDHDIAGLKT